MTADNEPTDQNPALTGDPRRRTIRRTAIVLAVIAFAWYLGFMALRLL